MKELQMPSADEIFRSELDKRHIPYSVTAEGVYDLDIEGQTVSAGLENIRRGYARDGDAEAIVRFVDSITADLFADTPMWNDVRPRIRYCLEPSNYETGFDDVVHVPVSDELNQVFVYTTSDGRKIIWINKSMLDDWGVTRPQLVQQAEENMGAIVADTKLEVRQIDGSKLGMLSTEETPFKGSLILSPAFRRLVSATHGWPVCVVVPCRDFVYVLRDDDRRFLGRLGVVVVDQYRNSGYPITKDVLRVSDNGIVAIGTYPDPE